MPVLNENGAFSLTNLETAAKQKRKNRWGSTLTPINMLTGSRPTMRQAPESSAAKKQKLAGKDKKPDFKVGKFKPFKGQMMGAGRDKVKEFMDNAIVEGLGQDKDLNLDDKAKSKHLNYLIALCFNKRDIEDGAGERDLSYYMFIELYFKFPETMLKLLKLWVYDYGSLLDLNKISCIIAEDLKQQANEDVTIELYKNLKNEIIKIYADSFNDDKQKLNAAKWAPRINKSVDRLTNLGKDLANFMFPPSIEDQDNSLTKKSKMNASYKCYRTKLTIENSENLEVKMCAKEFTHIGDNLTKIPGKAMSQYRFAFMDEYKYGEKAKTRRHELNDERTYLRDQLSKLTKRAIENPELNLIKGGKTMQPHELIREVYNNQNNNDYQVSPVHEAQWEALKSTTKKAGSLQNTVVMSDVSGSMGGIPMEVSIALGLLIAEIQEGAWSRRVMTFSEDPAWFEIPKEGGLKEKVVALSRAPWGGSTDMEKAIMLVLDLAKENNIKQEDMPKNFIILTDMHFNEATSRYVWNSATRSYERPENQCQFNVYKKRFEDAGYEFPVIIFWNLRSNNITFQNESDQEGFINLAGFSIALLKSILAGDSLDLTQMSPIDMLLETLSKKRYDKVFKIIEECNSEGVLSGFEKWSFEDDNNYEKEVGDKMKD